LAPAPVRALSVAWLLASRDWLGEFRRSPMSAVWPLCNTAGYTALFVLLRPLLGQQSTGTLEYAVHVFVGFALWQGWIDVLRAQLTAIRRHRGLISRGEIGFGTLTLTTALVVGLQSAPRLVLASVAAIAVLDSTPVAIICLLLFGAVALLNGAVIGAMLQPFATLSAGVDAAVQSMALAVLMTAGVFVALPEQPAPALALVLAINPVGSLIDAARSPLFARDVLSWGSVWAWTALTAAGLVVAPRVGRRLLPIVTERLGN
jgi:ABC-type polysaccharide/polyol phosphate export permease